MVVSYDLEVIRAPLTAFSFLSVAVTFFFSFFIIEHLSRFERVQPLENISSNFTLTVSYAVNYCGFALQGRLTNHEWLGLLSLPVKPLFCLSLIVDSWLCFIATLVPNNPYAYQFIDNMLILLTNFFFVLANSALHSWHNQYIDCKTRQKIVNYVTNFVRYNSVLREYVIVVTLLSLRMCRYVFVHVNLLSLRIRTRQSFVVTILSLRFRTPCYIFVLLY